MYAVYHGPQGIAGIARRVHALTRALAAGLQALGHDVGNDAYFDTLRVHVGDGNAATVLEHARARRINLRPMDDNSVGVSLDETMGRTTVRETLPWLLWSVALSKPRAT